MRACPDDDRGGARRENGGQIRQFEILRSSLVKFDIPADDDPVRHIGRDHQITFPVGFRLDADCVEITEDRSEKHAESAVSAHGAIRHAGVDQCKRKTAFLCRTDQIRPDFRFEDDESGRLDHVECFPHERKKINRAEDHFDAFRHFPAGNFLSGCGRGRQYESAVRVKFPPRLKGRQRKIGLSDAYRVHPDRMVQCFQPLFFFSGEDGEPFGIIFFGPRTADQLDQQSRQKKQKRQRENDII